MSRSFGRGNGTETGELGVRIWNQYRPTHLELLGMDIFTFQQFDQTVNFGLQLK